MMLAGFQQLVFQHSLGGTYDRPVRGICFHTTEGTTVAGAVSVYKRIQACPHLTVDPETLELFQHVPLDSSCYALRNLQGGCQTNTTGIIQIEIVGYAAESWSWSKQRLQWLGEEVLRPILAAYPDIPRSIYNGWRMTCDEWDAWPGGICGHRDVPENDHWDPGDLQLAQILDYAIGDDDMATPAEIWAYPLTIEGVTAPAGEWLGYLYAEVTRPDKLTKRVADAVAADGGVVSGGATPGQIADELARRLTS
jgi:hypothetical protein